MKNPRISVFELAKELKARGLTAQTFNGGLHWRIVGKGIDLWPSTGRWKWMTTKNSGTLADFVNFLNELPEMEKLLEEVVVRKS